LRGVPAEVPRNSDRVPVARRLGIDEGEPAAVVDQLEVADTRSQPVDGIGDLHVTLLARPAHALGRSCHAG
jgi:hypothetical protein